MAGTFATAGYVYAAAGARRTPRPRRGAVDAVLTALLGALVVAAVLVLALAAAGVRPRVEMSDSMRPVLHAGDVVWVRRIAASEARPGDVVAFADPEHRRVLMHRVASVREAGAGRLEFVTKGDANTGTERWRIAASGAIGRYAGLKVPSAGRVVAAAQGAPLAIAAIAGGLGLAVLLLRRIWAPR